MRTIRQALTWKLLLGFASLLTLAGLSVFLLIRDELLEQFDDALRAKAMAIAAVTTQRDERVEIDSSGRFMREFDAPDSGPERRDADADDDLPESGPDGFFQLWLADGKTIARSESLHQIDLPIRVGLLDRPIFWNLGLPSGRAGRAVGLAFRPRETNPRPTAGPNAPPRQSPPEQVALVVASDRRDLDRTLTTLALVLSGCGGLLLAVTVLIVPRVLRRELAPLDALADQATRIDAETLATRFPTEPLPGELMPISQRLNDLLTRLEQSFERERQFSGDLAHELRTPIAELRSLAELAVQWPEIREPETDRECLAIALQMERIVSRLLALLRGERGQLSIVQERVALVPMLTDVWRPFARCASDKRLHVSWDVPEETVVQTDPVLMRSVLSNLIENAVEHSPPDGTVRISSERIAHQLLVRVANTAGIFTANDLPRLFDRLWRGDPARSGSDHSGLGLPLARGFARVLGWELAAVLEDGSLTFTLAGPVAVSGSTELKPGDTEDFAMRLRAQKGGTG